MNTPDRHPGTRSRSDRGTLRHIALLLAAALALQIGAASAVGCAAAEEERKADDSGKDDGEESVKDDDAGSEAVAGDEPREAAGDSAAKALAEGQRSFTNDDLRRYRKLAKASKPSTIVVDMTAPKAGEPGGDEAPAMDPAESQRRMEAIREEMRQADERLKVIDARTRSLHNPLLPRPKVSEEEKAAEAGMDARQIVESLAAERAEIQARLEELKAELESLSRAPVSGAGDAPLPETGPPAGGDDGGTPAPGPPRP